MKACLQSNQCTVPENTTLLQDFNQQYEKSTSKVFAYVSIQGWVIDPYEHWFFNEPGEVLLFPAHYTKIFKHC